MYNGNDFITYERLPNPIRIQLGNKPAFLRRITGSQLPTDAQGSSSQGLLYLPSTILYYHLQNWILMDIIQSLVTASVSFKILEIPQSWSWS